MRKSTFALALSFLAAIVWFGSQINQPRAAEDNKAQPAGPKQKWQYKYDLWNMAVDRGAVTNDLDKLGNEGWELIALFKQNDTNNAWSYVIFKRAAQP